MRYAGHFLKCPGKALMTGHSDVPQRDPESYDSRTQLCQSPVLPLFDPPVFDLIMPDPSPPPVTYRSVTAEDLASLAEFIAPFVSSGRLLPRTAEELNELLAHGFVAEIRGRMVGFAALEIYSHKLAEIRSLAVDQTQQGSGIGRELVSRCVQRARDRQILEVMAITSADGFFSNCGFDFTLPGERKALFIQTRDQGGRPSVD